MKNLHLNKFTPWRFTIVNPQSLQRFRLLAFGSTYKEAEKHIRDFIGFDIVIAGCYRISNNNTIVNAEFIYPMPLIEVSYES